MNFALFSFPVSFMISLVSQVVIQFVSASTDPSLTVNDTNQNNTQTRTNMNSLASILYSSSSANTTKRKNLSLQPTLKPTSAKKSSRYQVGMLFRSSTPKTPLQIRTKTPIKAHPTTTTLSSSASSSSSISSLSITSPQSPRCSTPLFSKQRRTRPFIACELCRQRAFQSFHTDQNKTKDTQIKKTNEKQQSYHHHSATLHYYQYQKNTSTSIQRRHDRLRSSIDQLLVWII